MKLVQRLPVARESSTIAVPSRNYVDTVAEFSAHQSSVAFVGLEVYASLYKGCRRLSYRSEWCCMKKFVLSLRLASVPSRAEHSGEGHRLGLLQEAQLAPAALSVGSRIRPIRLGPHCR